MGALEIAQFKVQKERKELGVEELDDDHRYKQILCLLEDPPDRVQADYAEKNETDKLKETEDGRTENVEIESDPNSIGLQAEVDLIVGDDALIMNMYDIEKDKK